MDPIILFVQTFGVPLSTIVVFLVVFTLVFYYRMPRDLPPGPTPLPVIGTAHAIKNYGSEMHIALTNLQTVYGDIFTIWLGPNPAIVLNGAMIREALVKQGDVFGGRRLIQSPLGRIIQGGITFNNGDSWREQRTFTMSHLKDLGFGRKQMEQKIQEETSKLLSQITLENGQPFDPIHLITFTIINILFSILLGKQFEYGDDKLKTFIDSINDTFRKGGLKNIVLSKLPFLKNISWLNREDIQRYNMMKDVLRFLQSIIDEHKLNLQAEHQTGNDDFVYQYLHKIAEEEDLHNSFTEQILLQVLRDIFSAGSETTSTILRWSMIYMITYPEIQSKVRNELLEVVSDNRHPLLEDRQYLHYTRAVISECFRVANIAALAVPHVTLDDAILGGYNIPKGTLVIANLMSLHMDQTHFTEPEVFNPERFLDKHGKFIQNDPNLLPFGIGRRQCPGELMARMEFFCIFTALIHNFEFSVPDGEPKPSLTGTFGVTNVPPNFRVCATRHIST